MPSNPASPRARRAFWRAPTPPPAHWLRVFRTAMACRFEVTLPVDRAAAVGPARAALHEADRLDTAWSVFRDDSLIAHINRTAAREAVPIDGELASLLADCRRLSSATEGAFDITSTPLSRCWRLLDRDGAVPADEVIAAARAVVGMRHVVLSFEADRQRSGATRDPERRAASLAGPEQPILDRPSSGRAPTVRFARPGVELNLGAIGKGHAVARIAARLRAQSIGPALVSAADSSIEAVGAPAGGWLIALREDRAQYGDGHAMSVEARGSTPHARIRLRRGALATSGSGEQGFVHDGVRYGHLVDPRTGWPVRGVARVTVGADAAADADALATAFLIGGPALARRYVEAHPRTVAIMTVSDDPRPLIIGHHPGMRVEVECS